MDAHLARLEPLLASQHGLATIDQMRAAEITNHARRRLVERKVLRRIRPGVYALRGARETWERGLLAAVLSIKDAVASHASAARLWRFAPSPEGPYEVTVPRYVFTERRGVTVHRSITVDPADVVERDGIRCTSFERTLCDCTTLLTTAQLGRALDDGLRRGVGSLSRLRGCAERLESGPGRHMSSIRRLLADRGVDFEPGGSRAELELLEVYRRAGIPLPVQQYRVRVAGRSYRPDFAWPEHRVLAEYYGTAFHSGASAVIADSARLTALAAAGWLPLVFTQASTPGEIVERTTEALRQRGVCWKMGA